MTTSRPAGLVQSLLADLEELAELVRLVAADPSDRLERRGSPGWTAAEVLAHLADFELVAAVRVRTVLTMDRPALASYGQEEFTGRFGHLESAAEALDRFAVNRRATARVLGAIGEADWDRMGVHPVRGEEPLRRTVEMVVRHDREHLEQFRRAAGVAAAEA